MANIDGNAKRRIADLLNDARERELIYLEVLMKSANLAAFQVIGKRVEWLEKPMKKEGGAVDLRDFFLDVLIDVVLGQAAGKLLQTSVESLLRPVIRSRQAYYVLPGGHQGISLKQVGVTKLTLGLNGDRLQTAERKAKEKISKHLTDVANREDFAAYRMVPETLVSSITEVGSDVARSHIDLPQGGPTTTIRVHGRGDVTIVRILSSVDESVAMQTLAVKKEYDELLSLLQYSDVSSSIAKLWIGFLEINRALAGDTRTRRTNARSYLILWYELAMWAHMVQREGAVSSSYLGKVYGGGESEQLIESRLRDPDRFKLEKSDAEETVFQTPAARASEEGIRGAYGVVQARYTVQLPRTWLEYWIARFPYSFSDPDGPTHLEKAEQMFHGMKPGDRRNDASKARAYDTLLTSFRFMSSSLEERFKYVQRALGI